MNKIAFFVLGLLLCLPACKSGSSSANTASSSDSIAAAAPMNTPPSRDRGRFFRQRVDTLHIDSLQMSDPFIFADEASQTYYLISTGGNGQIRARKSKDLVYWAGPYTIFQSDSTLWAGERCQVWAPEMVKYKDKYYLFATLTSNEIIEKIPNRYDIPRRAMQILVADSPDGPFRAMSNEQYTPKDWASLDGTLWVENGKPYMIFCHEWLQIVDGTMELVPLKDDLSGVAGEPQTLFKASQSPWSREMLSIHEKTYGLDLPGNVTDGPFLFNTQTGKLGMLWSGWSDNRYALGVSYSASGTVQGPWIHQEKLLYKDNGGHAMLFRNFDGELLMVLHYTNDLSRRPARKPIIMRVDDSGDELILKEKYTK